MLRDTVTDHPVSVVKQKVSAGTDIAIDGGKRKLCRMTDAFEPDVLRLVDTSLAIAAATHAMMALKA